MLNDKTTLTLMYPGVKILLIFIVLIQIFFFSSISSNFDFTEKSSGLFRPVVIEIDVLQAMDLSLAQPNPAVEEAVDDWGMNKIPIA